MTKEQEKEFFKLAGVYLACRWQVMGNTINGYPIKRDPKERLTFALLGMHDYQREMELLIESCK